jgi:hypothetical protein
MDQVKDSSNAPAFAEPLISSNDAARHINVTKSTLATWRCQRKGPRFFKLGRGCWYRATDLDAWIAKQAHDPEARA